MQTIECDAKICSMYVRLELSTWAERGEFYTLRYDRGTQGVAAAGGGAAGQLTELRRLVPVYVALTHTTRISVGVDIRSTFHATHNPTLCIDPQRSVNTLPSKLAILLYALQLLNTSNYPIQTILIKQ